MQEIKHVSRYLMLVLLFLVTHTYAHDEHAAGDRAHRSEAHKQRDQYRHPQQTLAFFSLSPHDHIVEIWPGGAGWYTEILAPYLRRSGKLYAAHFAEDSSVGYYKRSRKTFEEKLNAFPKVYDAVELTTLEPPKHTAIANKALVDKVLTFRNVHNWVKSGKQDAVFKAMYDALKPGGILGVVEHRAKPGTSVEGMIKSGYMTEAYTIALAEKAGFVFVASSEVNANANDSANHPKGVWTLPPSLRLGELDRKKYLAIGESDRMTLKFKKPDDVK